MSKKLIAIVVLVVALGGFFLGKLFKSKLSVKPLPSSDNISTPPLVVEAPSPVSPPEVKPLPVPQFQPKSVSQKYPPYKGRDPSEVRSIEEEAKLFSIEKKREIYKTIENYGQEVKKNPDFFQGWIQGGLLKKVIGDYEGARDMWEYAGLIRQANSVSFANLGELYWRYLPNFEKSEANFKTAIVNQPSIAEFYISLSDLYWYSYPSKKNMADSVLLEGLQKNPNDLNLVKALATFYERGQNYSKALEWWKKAQAINPNSADIAARIKEIEEKVSKQINK